MRDVLSTAKSVFILIKKCAISVFVTALNAIDDFETPLKVYTLYTFQ